MNYYKELKKHKTLSTLSDDLQQITGHGKAIHQLVNCDFSL